MAAAAKINLVLPSVGSTCEILFDLMEEDKMDRDIAMAMIHKNSAVHILDISQFIYNTLEILRLHDCLRCGRQG